MQAHRVLRYARRLAGLSLRELGERAQTSHATLSAYEHQRTQPSVETASRVIRAAGYRVESTLIPTAPGRDEARSAELLEALELAAAFPAKHAAKLRYPKFANVSRDRT